MDADASDLIREFSEADSWPDPIPGAFPGQPPGTAFHHPRHHIAARLDKPERPPRKPDPAHFRRKRLEADPSAGTLRWRLAEVMRERGETPASLGRRMGINRNLIGYYARNSPAIRLPVLARFCAALHCTPGDLLVWESAKPD